MPFAGLLDNVIFVNDNLSAFLCFTIFGCREEAGFSRLD